MAAPSLLTPLPEPGGGSYMPKNHQFLLQRIPYSPSPWTPTSLRTVPRGSWMMQFYFALDTSLTHLKNKDSYVMMLFIYFSAALDTGCWICLAWTPHCTSSFLDFLTMTQQSVRISNTTSNTSALSMGVPQGCVLSSLLFTLLTNDCARAEKSSYFMKFADDTIVVGNKFSYRSEVDLLARDNNFSFTCGKN